MFSGEGGPFFGKRIGGGFTLDFCHRLFDFMYSLAVPDCNLALVNPFLAKQKFLRHFKAIASEWRIFQLGINITGVVVFAVTAQPEQLGDHKLGALAGSGSGNSIAD